MDCKCDTSKYWRLLASIIILVAGHDEQVGKTSTSNTTVNGTSASLDFRRSEGTNMSAFKLLSYTTLGIFFCWTTVHVLYTLIDFGFEVPDWLLQTGNIMYNVNTVLDPLLFMAALPILRRTLRKMTSCKR